MGTASGTQVFQFSQIWLIHELTGSPLYLGFVGLAQALPALSLNLIGGAVADKVDKRRLIAITSSLSATLMLTLATLTLLEWVQVWHVLVVASMVGAVTAFDYPTRMAIYPHLVDRSALTSAVALDGSVWWGTRIISPAIAGIVVATAGTAAAMYIGGAGLLTAAIVMARLTVRYAMQRAQGGTGRRLIEGLSYIKGNSAVAFLLSMSLFTSFFGMSYMYLMPIFAVDILDVGSEGQGVLMSASAIGALIISIWVGSKGSFRRRGPVLITGATLAGLSVAAFGLTSEYVGSYALAFGIMFFIGLFNSLYMVSNTTSLQMLIPDQMRGRVMGIHTMSISMIPLSGMQAGAVANVIGAPFAVMIGGLVVTAFALGPALFNRRIRNLSSEVSEAEQERAKSAEHPLPRA
jgi:MFS family permease